MAAPYGTGQSSLTVSMDGSWLGKSESWNLPETGQTKSLTLCSAPGACIDPELKENVRESPSVIIPAVCATRSTRRETAC